MQSFLKKKIQRMMVLRGAFVPWRVAPYLRSKRVQAGLITRSLLLPSMICMTSYFFVDTSLMEGGDINAALESLPKSQMANLFLILIVMSIISGTLILSLMTHLVGKLIEVPDLSMRKSVAMSGWAILCSFVLSVPISFFASILNSPNLTGITQVVVVYVFMAVGWRKAAGANPAQLITLFVLTTILSLAAYLSVR